MTMALEVLPEPLPKDSTFFTTSMPSTTSPNTTCVAHATQCQPEAMTAYAAGPTRCQILLTCLPSSHGQGTVVTKNWEPLVLGPALAMDCGGPGRVRMSDDRAPAIGQR